MRRAEYLQRRRDWNEQRTARGLCRTCENAVERFVHCAECRRKRAKAEPGVGHRWTPEEARWWSRHRRIDDLRHHPRDVAILGGDPSL